MKHQALFSSIDVSSESYARQKHQALFSSKDKSKTIVSSSANFYLSLLQFT